MNDESTLEINGSSVDLAYYEIVRTTLHGIDNLRLKTAVAGLTISAAFLATTIPMIKLLGIKEVGGFVIPLGLVLASITCVLTFIITTQFIKKMAMFSFFLHASVKIAEEIEEKIIVDRALRLTHQFNQHEFSSNHGDSLFLISLKFMRLFSVVCCLTYIMIAISTLIY